MVSMQEGWYLPGHARVGSLGVRIWWSSMAFFGGFSLDYVSLDLLFTALCPAPPTGFGGSLLGVSVSRVSLFPSPMTPELVLSESVLDPSFLEGHNCRDGSPKSLVIRVSTFDRCYLPGSVISCMRNYGGVA